MSVKGLRYLAAFLIAVGIVCLAAGAVIQPQEKQDSDPGKRPSVEESRGAGSRPEETSLTAQYNSREYSVPAEQIRSLEISTIVDEVQLLPGSADTLKAVFYENEDLWYETQMTEKGVLQIEQKARGQNVTRKDDDLKLWIYLPDGVEELTVLSVSGDIEAADLTLPANTLFQTTSGDLDVKRCKADALKLQSVSGAIDAEADIQELTAESMSGDVELELWGVAEDYTLKIETVSGKTRAGGGSGERNVAVSTISGDIEVRYISAWDPD